LGVEFGEEGGLAGLGGLDWLEERWDRGDDGFGGWWEGVHAFSKSGIVGEPFRVLDGFVVEQRYLAHRGFDFVEEIGHGASRAGFGKQASQASVREGAGCGLKDFRGGNAKRAFGEIRDDGAIWRALARSGVTVTESSVRPWRVSPGVSQKLPVGELRPTRVTGPSLMRPSI